MGLLDQLAGQVLGGGQGNTMVQLVMALINNTEGGLPGVLAKLRAGGLAEVVATWLGGGANASVGAGELKSALGTETITQLARQFGLTGDAVASGLAEALPGLVDTLSPQGEVANDNALLEQGLSMLGGLFSGR